MFNAVLKRPGLPGEVVVINSEEDIAEYFPEGAYCVPFLDTVFKRKLLYFETCGAGFNIAKAKKLNGRQFNFELGGIRYFGDVLTLFANEYDIPLDVPACELKRLQAWLS